MDKRQEIISKLFKEDKITLEEMLVLLEREVRDTYLPYISYTPYRQTDPYYPYHITYGPGITTTSK